MDKFSSKQIKYKIAIREPEQWKIESIAEYKRRQLAKTNSAEHSLLRSNSISGSKKGFKRKNSISNGVDGDKLSSLHSSDDQNVGKQNITLPISVATSNGIGQENQLNAVTDFQQEALLQERQKKLDLVLHELDICNTHSIRLKQRIHDYHAVRGNFLWLLKKAVKQERMTIHEHLGEVALGKGNNL